MQQLPNFGLPEIQYQIGNGNWKGHEQKGRRN